MGMVSSFTNVFVCVSLTVVIVVNSWEMKFGIALTGCHQRSILGIPLSDCGIICQRFQQCSSINYRPVSNFCQLNACNTTYNESRLSMNHGSVYIENQLVADEDMDSKTCTTDKCKDIIKTNDEGCGSPAAVVGAVVFGNVWSSGGLIKYRCHFGVKTTPEDHHPDVTSTCQSSGLWQQPRFKCRVKTMGTKCTEDTACIEINSLCSEVCICQPGYSYHQANNACEIGCVQYGDTFQATSGKQFPVNPTERVHGNDKECMAVCLLIDCVTFVYWPNAQLCYLKWITMAMDPGMVRENVNAITYTRDCN